MNTTHTPDPEDIPAAVDGGPGSSLHRELDRCPCGAVADGGTLCRKCQARATWDRRLKGRTASTGITHRPRGTNRPAARPFNGADSHDSTRPRGRRPGR